MERPCLLAQCTYSEGAVFVRVQVAERPAGECLPGGRVLTGAAGGNGWPPFSEVFFYGT
jgi:hypothetical protein